MYDTINVRSSVTSLKKQDRLMAYSKVHVDVTDELFYEAGDDTGRTLTMFCPWGTQATANKTLARIRGYQHQPYTAVGAYIDPATEVGDAVSVGSVFGGVLTKNVTVGPLYVAEVSAPGEESIDYKYEYKSPTQRQIERNYSEMKSTFKVQANQISAEVSARIEQGNELNSRLDIQSDQISARVTKTGGSSSSFGWDLLDDSWTIKANNTTVFQVTKFGAEVRGKITALSGKIGGFDIQSDYLSYNNQDWNDTNSQGIYIGVKGIQCGPGDTGVQLTPDGNLYAENGYFRGSVRAGMIDYGGDDGYFNGKGLESRSVSGLEIAASTVSTTNTTGGINTSLGYADFANGVFNGWNTASYVDTSVLFASSFYFQDYEVIWRTITDGNGLSQTVLVRS